jgi:RNA polymerase sigma-70 factor (ECF subfamily)
VDSEKRSAALDRLCRAYWYPLYAYVRRKGHSSSDAQDLTQDFFARLLEHGGLAGLQPVGGRFRSFLLTALNHFLTNQWQRQQTQKRGGGRTIFSLDELDAEARYRIEPADDSAPETAFDRRWALALLDQTHDRLRNEYRAEGKAELFDHLQCCLTGADQALGYADLAARQQTTEGALRVAVHRLRKRYGQLLRAEVAQTVADPREIEGELRYLMAAAIQRI